MSFLMEFIATGFFVGKIPIAPGTFGTLVGIPLVLFFSIDEKIFLFSIAVVFFLGWLSSEYMVRNLNDEDPEEVVIDEILGYMCSFLFVEPNFKTIILAFIIFRIIDVFKPFPVKLFENFPGGLGVIADDFVGGVITSAVLYFLLH